MTKKEQKNDQKQSRLRSSRFEFAHSMTLVLLINVNLYIQTSIKLSFHFSQKQNRIDFKLHTVPFSKIMMLSFCGAKISAMMPSFSLLVFIAIIVVLSSFSSSVNGDVTAATCGACLSVYEGDDAYINARLWETTEDPDEYMKIIDDIMSPVFINSPGFLSYSGMYCITLLINILSVLLLV